MTDKQIKALVERLRGDLAEIQHGDRPLPWVVHSGCSYRRIASEPTRENLRSFPDGNVLHAYNQQSDGHPDLSMGEDQLTALVRIVNAQTGLLDLLQSLLSDRERLREALDAIIDRGPERDIKWAGMTARDIARSALDSSVGVG